ncbi:hypothetical protein BHE74_00023256 [Ensete ventricosum]|nr:hypothetical protein BHE74_00023256 [Ensete ventricosum]RZR82873.1 hypothetical protein BHM03_00009401 [Ensete ventricosum]
MVLTRVGDPNSDRRGRICILDWNQVGLTPQHDPKSSTTFLALEEGLMSQERPTSNPNSEHPGGFTHILPLTLQAVGQTPHFPAEEPNTVVPTPNCYWRLLNDPRFTPPAPNRGPPAVSTEAFLDLTQQVQTLAGMMQAIVPYIPQLAQALAHQCSDAPRQTLQ